MFYIKNLGHCLSDFQALTMTNLSTKNKMSVRDSFIDSMKIMKRSKSVKDHTRPLLVSMYGYFASLYIILAFIDHLEKYK